MIVHSLAVYPAENMPAIASMAGEQDRSAGLAYEDLSFMDRGTPTRGFYGKVGGSQVISPGTNFLISGREVPVKNAETDNSVAEIILYRGIIFEVLKMTGSGTNACLLEDIALKASAKLP